MQGHIPLTKTTAHDTTASRMAAAETHIAMQTVVDDKECPVFLGSGFVGKAQYIGLTRFLQTTIRELNITISSCHPES